MPRGSPDVLAYEHMDVFGLPLLCGGILGWHETPSVSSF